jgi:hypothetical protein
MITLGTHIGDNPVDHLPIKGSLLGTSGGCHRAFISVSTDAPQVFALSSHLPVDRTHRADLAKCWLSPISTAPTTTTKISMSIVKPTAVGTASLCGQRPHRVTTPNLICAGGNA